jgi:hypothetical protein
MAAALDHHGRMKTAARSLLRLAPASLLILVAACAGARPAPPPASDPAATAALWQQLQAENADTACDSDSQCHSLGVGAKACGGPERYLAWSSKQGDGAKLKALAEQHSAARRADDAREHMMSTCSLVSDPGAVCRAGRCVLNPVNRASPGGAAIQK